MKILGIDTTTKFLSIGLYDGKQIYEYNLETGRRLSALLVPTIKRILDALDWQAADIDYFACGLGPGSFTGMRVGISTIKGMSFTLNKPVIGISTLDILAKNVKDVEGYIMPMIDAKRNLIYCSLYKIKGNIIKRIMPYLLLTEKEFFKKIKANSIILGDALNLYKEKILSRVKGVTILDKDYWYPKGSNIIELARERIKAKKFLSSFKVKPIYLYPKECQINVKFKM
jgi:tRNA threonylcarbamoyladenosine biosynthesis protein TsaB